MIRQGYRRVCKINGNNHCNWNKLLSFRNKMFTNRHLISHKIVVCRWQKTMEMNVVTEMKAKCNEWMRKGWAIIIRPLHCDLLWSIVLKQNVSSWNQKAKTAAYIRLDKTKITAMRERGKKWIYIGREGKVIKTELEKTGGWTQH
jgi:hypothetical protein